MATSTKQTSYFAGPETTQFSQDYLHTSTTEQMPVGTVMKGDNGDKYVYVKAGGAIVTGKTVQAPAPIANFQGLAVAAAAAAGDVTVTLTLGATALTANQFAGGEIKDSLGNTYIVDSHLAADATDDVVITLKDSLRDALTTSNTASLYAGQYNGVIQTPATATSAVVGVAKIDIASGEYGFVLKEGVIATLIDGVPAVGASVSPSNAVSGAVESGVIAQGFIGRMIEVGVDTTYKLVQVSC